MTCGVSIRFSDQKSQVHLSVSLTTQTTYPIRVLTPFLEEGLTRKCSRIRLKKTSTLLSSHQSVPPHFPVSVTYPLVVPVTNSVETSPTVRTHGTLSQVMTGEGYQKEDTWS
jgi:hypothetical protein